MADMAYDHSLAQYFHCILVCKGVRPSLQLCGVCIDLKLLIDLYRIPVDGEAARLVRFSQFTSALGGESTSHLLFKFYLARIVFFSVIEISHLSTS